MPVLQRETVSLYEVGIANREGEVYHAPTHAKKWFNKSFFIEGDLKGAWIRRQLNDNRNGSRKTLTVEGVRKYMGDHCPQCGTKFNFDTTDKTRTFNEQPSIDRIRAGKNYKDGKTWGLCRSCNRRKQDWKSPKEMIEFALVWQAEEEARKMK